MLVLFWYFVHTSCMEFLMENCIFNVIIMYRGRGLTCRRHTAHLKCIRKFYLIDYRFTYLFLLRYNRNKNRTITWFLEKKPHWNGSVRELQCHRQTHRDKGFNLITQLKTLMRSFIKNPRQLVNPCVIQSVFHIFFRPRQYY